jgi:hypothetical protein
MSSRDTVRTAEQDQRPGITREQKSGTPDRKPQSPGRDDIGTDQGRGGSAEGDLIRDPASIGFRVNLIDDR